MIEPLVDLETPGHDYFDELNSPVETLVLSVDEYIAGGPFAECPQGLPLPTRRYASGQTAVRDPSSRANCGSAFGARGEVTEITEHPTQQAGSLLATPRC